MTQATFSDSYPIHIYREPVTVEPLDIVGLNLTDWKITHDIRHDCKPEGFEPSTRKTYCHCVGCGKRASMDIGGMYGFCSQHWQEYKALAEKEAGL